MKNASSTDNNSSPNTPPYNDPQYAQKSHKRKDPNDHERRSSRKAPHNGNEVPQRIQRPRRSQSSKASNDDVGYKTPKEESSYILRKGTWPKVFLDNYLSPLRGLRFEDIESIVRSIPYTILVGCSGAVKNEVKKELCLEVLAHVLDLAPDKILDIVHANPRSAFYWVRLDSKEQVNKAIEVGVVLVAKYKTFVY